MAVSGNIRQSLDGSAIPATDANQGTLQFSSTGSLTSVNGNAVTTDTNGNITAAPASPSLSFSGLSDGANDLKMDFPLFTATTGGGSTIYTPNLTQYAQSSGAFSNSQNGNAAVELSQVAIANGGAVVATYSDGEQVQVSQLAMANFINPGSLVAVGKQQLSNQRLYLERDCRHTQFRGQRADSREFARGIYRGYRYGIYAPDDLPKQLRSCVADHHHREYDVATNNQFNSRLI